MKDNYSYQLSCIVPVYNVERYIEDCVASLLQVSGICIQIILVDDGSTDLSAEILDRYAGKYSHVKVIHQSNSGVSVARNRGLEVAEGEYIAFVDSDDWVVSDELVRLNQQAKQNTVDMIL